MKRSFRLAALLIALCCLILAVATGCGKKKEVLNLYTWEGMFPQELLDDFKEKTGVEVNYVNFDTNEAMLAKLQAAEGGDYDVILCDDYIVPQVIEAGLATELDRSKISTWNNINPIYQGQYYDPADKYTVPCGAGIMEIVYRPSATGFDLTCYEDLWDPRLKDSVGIIANPRVINGIVLKMNGESFNTTNIDAIRAVSEKLASLAPNIKLVKDQFMENDLVSGEISAGLVYTGVAFLASMEDSELITVLPKEGLGFGIMPLFIPANAPNKEAAYKFIEFINEPEHAATLFTYMGYYDTNKASEEYLDSSVRRMLVIPEEIRTEDMEMIENIPGEVYSVHEEVWTDFLNHLS